MIIRYLLGHSVRAGCRTVCVPQWLSCPSCLWQGLLWELRGLLTQIQERIHLEEPVPVVSTRF